MKRKSIAMLLTLIMMLTLMTPLVFAEDNQMNYNEILIVKQKTLSEDKYDSQSNSAWVEVFGGPATVTAGDIFDVEICVGDFDDLYGASINFKYDNTILDVVEYNGKPVDDSGSIFVSEGYASTVNGYNLENPSIIQYAIHKMEDVPGFNATVVGDFTLGWITFQVKEGISLSSELELTVSDLLDDLDNGNANVIIKLSDSSGPQPQPINYKSYSNCIYIYNLQDVSGEIVLEWFNSENIEYELDSHLLVSDGNGGFHEVNWIDRGALHEFPHALLYNDDYGYSAAEQTLYNQLIPGSEFWVNDWEEGNFSTISGTVSVEVIGTAIDIDKNSGNGDWWHVFDVGPSGEIQIVNEINNGPWTVIPSPTIKPLLEQTYSAWNDGIITITELDAITGEHPDVPLEIYLPDGTGTGSIQFDPFLVDGYSINVQIQDLNGDELYSTNSIIDQFDVDNGMLEKLIPVHGFKDNLQAGNNYRIVAVIEVYDNNNLIAMSNTSDPVIFSYESGAQLSSDATLSNLTVDDITIEGFDSNTFTYNVELPTGTTQAPIVNGIVNDSNANISNINQAVAVPGTATIEVTAEDGTIKIYTINFIPKPSSPTIKALAEQTHSVWNDGIITTTELDAITGEHPDISLEIDLPDGIGIGSDEMDIKDGYWIEVIIQDVNSGEIRLESISPIRQSDIDSEIKSKSIPVNSLKENLEIGENYNLLASILVFENDNIITGSDLSLPVTFTYEAGAQLSSDATLSDLTVNGVTVEGFDSNTFTYDVELPAETTQVPVVGYTTSDTNATAQVTNATGLPGTTTVQVTAEDGTIETYTMNFTVEQFNDSIVTVDKVDGVPGSTIKVPITIDNASGMAGVQFDLAYDPNVAIATGFELGSDLSNFIDSVNLDNASSGGITVGIISSLAVTENKYVIGSITFDIVGSLEDVTPLEMNNLLVKNELGDTIPSQAVNGEIDVSIMYGNVNDDKVVDIGDAILVLRHAVGLIQLEGSELEAANVTKYDDVVDIGDAILVLRYAVGLIDTFPIEE